MTLFFAHAVLRLTPATAAAQVEGAYEALRLRWHPSHNSDPGATERMAVINRAYRRVLKSNAGRMIATVPEPRPRTHASNPSVPEGWSFIPRLADPLRRDEPLRLDEPLRRDEPLRLIVVPHVDSFAW